jgi:hypothetical protein
MINLTKTIDPYSFHQLQLVMIERACRLTWVTKQSRLKFLYTGRTFLMGKTIRLNSNKWQSDEVGPKKYRKMSKTKKKKRLLKDQFNQVNWPFVDEDKKGRHKV